MKKSFISFLFLMLLMSCASYQPPKTYVFPKSRTYNKSYDEVWSRIIQWFGMHNTPIKNIDKSSGFISTEYALNVDNYSGYCDCGKPGSFMTFKRAYGNFNIIVTKQEENKTNVNINTFFKSFYLIYNLYTEKYYEKEYNCNSTGVLEKELFEYIDK